MKYIVLTLIFCAFSCAKCVCECVDGHVEAICERASDFKPICPPRVCPIVPPSIAPIQTPRVPPPGASSCFQSQVYNKQERKYEWREICR